jgi:hypothetical protein
MAATLLQFQGPVAAPNGTLYVARAAGAEFDGPSWQGWIEFIPTSGGPALRTSRETTQPNRVDLEYWATGLTPVYLEGALARAIEASVKRPARPLDADVAVGAIFDGPAEPRHRHSTVHEPGAVLDPFSVYRKGEALLRSQLLALSPWHLANIVLEYELAFVDREWLETQSSASLAEIIVREVRARAGEQTRA